MRTKGTGFLPLALCTAGTWCLQTTYVLPPYQHLSVSERFVPTLCVLHCDVWRSWAHRPFQG